MTEKMEDNDIIEKVKYCINLLHDDFKESDYYSEHEIEIHFNFYHILCKNIPFLFQPDTLYDCSDNRNKLMKKAKRIWIETETEDKYPYNKEGRIETENKYTHNKRGRFDIVIYGKSEKQVTPLVAIELKTKYKPKKELFHQDFVKLSGTINGVKYPIFIYLEHHNYNEEYENMFKTLKKDYPSVHIFYLADDKYEEIQI